MLHGRLDRRFIVIAGVQKAIFVIAVLFDDSIAPLAVVGIPWCIHSYSHTVIEQHRTHSLQELRQEPYNQEKPRSGDTDVSIVAAKASGLSFTHQDQDVAGHSSAIACGRASVTAHVQV
jgi:hypothetical protein